MEAERLAAEEARRAAQRPRHNKLDMVALLENGPEDTASLAAAMQGVPADALGRPAQFADWTFDDDKREARELEDLRKRFGKMVVHARAKVTANRIYSAAYHPEVTKDLIFFGDRNGQLGI